MRCRRWSSRVWVTAALLAIGAPMVSAPVASSAVVTASLPASDEDVVTPQDPLEVTLREVFPSSVPTRGRIRVEGTVRNVTDQEWTDLQVFLQTSPSPLTTASALREALDSAPDAVIGDRLAEAGLFDEIDALNPGASATFSLSIPRAELEISGAEGVYWLGVQVLGTADGAREAGSDGRDRVLYPLVAAPNRRDGVPAATAVGVIWPQRARVGYEANGKVAGLASRLSDFGDNGKLGQAAAVVAAAGRRTPLIPVVDPALVELAEAVDGENQGWALRRGGAAVGTDADHGNGGANQDGESSDPGGSDAADRESDSAPDGPSDTSATDRAKGVGRSWSETLLDQGEVWTLPYGDPEITGLLVNADIDVSARLLALARSRGEQLWSRRELSAREVLVPRSGALQATDLLALEDQEILVPYDVAAAAGLTQRSQAASGPILSPYEPLGLGALNLRPTWLQLRQRVLAQGAVVRLDAEGGPPALMSIPASLTPVDVVDAERFAAGLIQPWLEFADPAAIQSAPSELEELPDVLDFGDGEQLASPVIAGALTVLDLADALRASIARPALISQELERAALVALGSTQVDRSGRMARRLARTDRTISGLLEQVEMAAPQTFSAGVGAGTMQVVLTNPLNTTLSLEVRARPVPGMQVTPSDTFSLGPGKSRAIRLPVELERGGLYALYLELTTPEGTVLQTSKPIRVRGLQQQVGMWVLLGIGGVFIVFVAWRRIRQGGRREISPELKQGGAR